MKTDALTHLILEVFRLNGVLLDVGDKMTAPLGLTSARWQVLGAISMENERLTVSQISRKMGLSRQAVQRVVADLEGLGFVRLTDNPYHKKARLVGLTERSAHALEDLERLQSNWATGIVDGVDAARLDEVLEMVRTIRIRCENSEPLPDEKAPLPPR